MIIIKRTKTNHRFCHLGMALSLACIVCFFPMPDSKQPLERDTKVETPDWHA